MRKRSNHRSLHRAAAAGAAAATLAAVATPATANAADADTDAGSIEEVVGLGSQSIDMIDETNPDGLVGSIEQLGLPPELAAGINITARVLRGERSPADLVDYFDINGSLAPTVQCPGGSDDGGRGHFTQWVDIGAAGPSTIHLRYETFSIPDNVDVFYQGANVYHSGLVGTNGNVDVDIALPAGTDGRVKVVVYAPYEGTAWNYDVSCAA